MEEELMNITTEQSIEVKTSEVVKAEVVIHDEEYDISTKEVTEVVEITPTEEIIVVMDEATGWVGGDSERHYSLIGRDDPNQHPITAIAGLREELNEIERLKSIYSDKPNTANYYEWEDAAYNEHGYFVSIVPNTSKIKLCNGTDIFGVSVDAAGFIGNQDAIVPRNNSYGLIVTSGLVDVRCELEVEVGDCVVSNARGYAKKSDSNYGYRVLTIEDKDGVKYAVILLGVQADITNALGNELQGIDERLDAAETNIVSAINVANQAYNKASEIGVSNQEMSNKVDEALDIVDRVTSDVESLETQVSNSAVVSAQAKAIAESAAVSAESMRNEAIEEANKALAETSELRKEFEANISEINTDLENSALELNTTKENLNEIRTELKGNIDDAVRDLEDLERDLEPLATWPNGSNTNRATALAGFVARADDDSATLASVTKFEGEFGKAISGFVQEATKENATVKAIASYQQKDEDGNPTGPSGASVLIGQVDANKASIDALVNIDGEGFSGLAGLMAQVNKNTSSVTTLASHVIGEFENTDDWTEDGKDINTVYYAKNRRLYYYYNKSDSTWHSTTKLHEAGLEGTIAGVQSVADESKSQLDAMVAYDKNGKSALAGMTAYVDENSANFSQLANYNNKDSGNKGISGIIADVDDNTSTLSAVINHEFTKNDGTKVKGLAGLNAYVNETESNVSLVSDRVAGKYIVLEEAWNTNGKDVNTVYYVKAIEKDQKDLWYYYDNGWKSSEDPYAAGLPRAMAGIQAKTDNNSASINNLVSWKGDTNIAMARIEQKADANGAYIQTTVSNMDKYTVGPYSQAYGFTLEQATSILEDGMIYVPTVLKTGSDAETYMYKENGQTKTMTRSFVPGYLYRWGGLSNGLHGWITVDKFNSQIDYDEAETDGGGNLVNTSAMSVYFTSQQVPTCTHDEKWGFWYVEGDNDIVDGDITYNAHTLYKWQEGVYPSSMSGEYNILDGATINESGGDL